MIEISYYIPYYGKEFEVIPPLMISDKNVQECDATDDDCSNADGK